MKWLVTDIFLTSAFADAVDAEYQGGNAFTGIINISVDRALRDKVVIGQLFDSRRRVFDIQAIDDIPSADFLGAAGLCAIHLVEPENTVGILKSKSGLNVKHGLTSEGVIDVGYTGSITVKLYNNSGTDYTVERGDKISQLVILPIVVPSLEVVTSLEETARGNGGFGSTGR